MNRYFLILLAFFCSSSSLYFATAVVTAVPASTIRSSGIYRFYKGDGIYVDPDGYFDYLWAKFINRKSIGVRLASIKQQVVKLFDQRRSVQEKLTKQQVQLQKIDSDINILEKQNSLLSPDQDSSRIEKNTKKIKSLQNKKVSVEKEIAELQADYALADGAYQSMQQQYKEYLKLDSGPMPNVDTSSTVTVK